MRVDVARAQFGCKQLRERALDTTRTIVDHHRNIRNRSRLYGLLIRLPLRPCEVRAFDSYNESGILQGHLSCRHTIHIFEVVLELPTTHPRSDNIQLCQHTGLRTVDDAIFEIREVSPARSTSIHDCCYSNPEGEAIGIDAIIACIRISLTRSCVDVSMQVYKTRRHI